MTTGKKAKPSYFNAIAGVALVLFMLGMLGWLLINGRALSRAFKEDIEVSVNFHDNTSDENIRKMQSVLDKQPFVRKTRVVTKEDAIKMESQVEGHNVEEFLGYNPLYASVIVKLNEGYVNKDSLAKIKQFVMQSNIVRSVSWPDTVVDKMNSNLKKIGIILACISVLLFVAVIFLIDNTVRLAMFSNRFLIKTMQMVGATQKFISRPFDKRAVVNGLISGLVAVVALWMVVKFATSQLESLNTLNDPILLGSLMVSMVVMGIFISYISTHRSVAKYLKMHIDDLY